MTELQKEFEATGYSAWINSDIYPDGRIYTKEYTEWLEKRVEALRKHGVIKPVCEHYFARKADGTLMPCEFCGITKESEQTVL